jgi:putative tricarboxylic transport membrane protein
MVLGCILGAQAENAFMTTMLSYQNDMTVFFKRPIAGTTMLLAAISLVYPLIRHLRRQRSTRLTGASDGR